MKKITLLFMALLAMISVQAAELNIFANNVVVNQKGTDVTVSYNLNAPATAITLQLLDVDNTSIADFPITDAKAMVKGANQADVMVNVVPSTGQTWAIKAQANPVTAFAEVTSAVDTYKFYLPQGVAVNNISTSPYFGKVYVAMPYPGESDGSCARTKTQKAGLYVFDASLKAENEEAYQFGLTFVAGNRSQFKRVKVGEDGSIYVNRQDAATCIYKINPANMETIEDTITDSKFTKIAAFVPDGKAMWVLDYGTESAVYKVVNGVATKIVANSTWANTDVDMDLDGRGGVWIIQHRYGADANAALAHVTADGTIDFKLDKNSPTEVLDLFPCGYNFSYRGTLALNSDKSILAFAGNKRVSLYAISYDESTGVPSIDSVIWRSGSIGTNIDGIAFDAADNLYFQSATVERFYVYSTPKADNSFVTPACESTIEPPFEPVEGDNILWTINDPNASFGDITASANKFRDLAYYNDQLIVLTNPLVSGNPRILKLNANTGKFLGNVSVSGIWGGDISLGSIQVLDNGEMVAMSCRVNPTTGTVKFYGWDNLNADPAKIGEVNFTFANRVEALFYQGTLANGKFYCASESNQVAVVPVVNKAVVADDIYYITLDMYTMGTAPRVVSVTDDEIFICCKGQLYGWQRNDSITTTIKKWTDTPAASQEATNGFKFFEYKGEKRWAALNYANESANTLADPQIYVASYTSIGRWSAAGKTQVFLSDKNLLKSTTRNVSFTSGIAVRVNEDGYNVWMCSLQQGIIAYQFVEKTGPATEIDNIIENTHMDVKKVMLNGQIYIIRDGHMFNMQGQLVK